MVNGMATNEEARRAFQEARLRARDMLDPDRASEVVVAERAAAAARPVEQPKPPEPKPPEPEPDFCRFVEEQHGWTLFTARQVAVLSSAISTERKKFRKELEEALATLRAELTQAQTIADTNIIDLPAIPLRGGRRA